MTAPSSGASNHPHPTHNQNRLNKDVKAALLRSDWVQGQRVINQLNTEIAEIEKSKKKAHIFHVASITTKVISISIMCLVPFIVFLGVPTWVPYVVTLFGSMLFMIIGAKLADKRNAILKKRGELINYRDELVNTRVAFLDKAPVLQKLETDTGKQISESNLTKMLKQASTSTEHYDAKIGNRLGLEGSVNLTRYIMMTEEEAAIRDKLWKEVQGNVVNLKRENNLVALKDLASSTLHAGGVQDSPLLLTSLNQDLVDASKNLCGIALNAIHELLQSFEIFEQKSSQLQFLPHDLLLVNQFIDIKKQVNEFSVTVYSMLHALEDAKTSKEQFHCLVKIEKLGILTSLTSILSSLSKTNNALNTQIMALPEAQFNNYSEALLQMRRVLREDRDVGAGLSARKKLELEKEGNDLLTKADTYLQEIREQYSHFIIKGYAEGDISEKTQLLLNNIEQGQDIDVAMVEQWLKDTQAIIKDRSVEKAIQVASEYNAIKEKLENFYQIAIAPIEEVALQLEGSLTQAVFNEIKDKFLKRKPKAVKFVQPIQQVTEKKIIDLLSGIESLSSKEDLPENIINKFQSEINFFDYQEVIEESSNLLLRLNRQNTVLSQIDEGVFSTDSVSTFFTSNQQKISHLIKNLKQQIRKMGILKASTVFASVVISIIFLILNMFYSLSFLPCIFSLVGLLIWGVTTGITYIVDQKQKKINHLHYQQDLLEGGKERIVAAPVLNSKLAEYKELQAKFGLEGIQHTWAKILLDKKQYQDMGSEISNKKHVFAELKKDAKRFSSLKIDKLPVAITGNQNFIYSNEDQRKLKQLHNELEEIDIQITLLDKELESVAEEDKSIRISKQRLTVKNNSDIALLKEKKAALNASVSEFTLQIEIKQKMRTIFSSALAEVTKVEEFNREEIQQMLMACKVLKDNILVFLSEKNTTEDMLKKLKSTVKQLTLDQLKILEELLEVELVALTPLIGLFGYALKNQIKTLNKSTLPIAKEIFSDIRTKLSSLSKNELETLQILLIAETTLNPVLEKLVKEAVNLGTEEKSDIVLLDELNQTRIQLQNSFKNDNNELVISSFSDTSEQRLNKIQLLNQLKMNIDEIKNKKNRLIVNTPEIKNLETILLNGQKQIKKIEKAQKAEQYKKLKNSISVIRHLQTNKIKKLKNEEYKNLLSDIELFIKTNASSLQDKTAEINIFLSKLSIKPKTFLQGELEYFSSLINKESLSCNRLQKEQYILEKSILDNVKNEQDSILKDEDTKSLTERHILLEKRKEKLNTTISSLKNDQILLNLKREFIYEEYPQSPYYRQFRDLKDGQQIFNTQKIKNLKKQKAKNLEKRAGLLHNEYIDRVNPPSVERKTRISEEYSRIQLVYKELKEHITAIKEDEENFIKKLSIMNRKDS
ncbi:hypothetical protein [Candidatus Clavichlamydia salmonicola]|uniref:hypothetical protein n=1 Tax=Candidatus Clavichlamydia salmonicola TaxID=469812 RepID=UPI001890D5C7|nr:hypothetical protein [Candidatus Clavichlamydia salmonicola]